MTEFVARPTHNVTRVTVAGAEEIPCFCHATQNHLVGSEVAAPEAENVTPRLRWQGQSIRVEHLVAPGGWLTTRGKHLASCACRCSEEQTCPECGNPSLPAAISGRWDEENGHTARPFDPVWVRLSCGCTFGDKAAAEPRNRPDAADEA